jgi:ATP-dependent DNA helicase RecG
MTPDNLKSQIALGEDSRRQFKQDVTNADALAAEMAAFANSEGGLILLGVADDGSTPGLSLADVARLNQLISNAASQHVRSPLTVRTENLELDNGRIVIVLTVPKGIDKPYFDRNGVIWLKSGADKRRVNSKEELRRLFQNADQFMRTNCRPRPASTSSTSCALGIFCATCTSSLGRSRRRS